MNLCALIVQYLFILIYGRMLAFGFAPQNQPKCGYTRSKKKLTITCYDMNLKEVPQDLKTSVEVINLRRNRIKKLKKGAFQRYRDVVSLLLKENAIYYIEQGTFEDLPVLMEIELADNALMTIPLELFQMPSLRNLYMQSNELINLEKDLEKLEMPIRAPLEYLNVADCGLEALPNLGVLPHLLQINASINPLTELSISSFANMCSLVTIDVTQTSINECTCQQINSHLRILNLQNRFVPPCIEILDSSICPLPYNQTVYSETFKSCESIVVKAETRSKWMFVAGCLSGVLLVLLLVWCCIRSRRKQREKKRKSKQSRKPFVISPKNSINPKSNYQEDELLERCCVTPTLS